MHVKGATSFQSLRTVGDIQYRTFREAAQVLGLLQSDIHFDQCLREASIFLGGCGLRQLFSLILAHNHPSDPQLLWDKRKTSIEDDCEYELRRGGFTESLTEYDIDQYALHLINQQLLKMGYSMEQCGLRSYDAPHAEHLLRRAAVTQELDHSFDSSKIFVYKQLPLLNAEQLEIFSHVRENYNSGLQTLLFIDGPGGTGKTFLLNTILHYFNSRRLPFLAVASSGVAAQLLLHGTTAHTAFGIPLSLQSNSTCSLAGRDQRSQSVQEAHILIWDEISMHLKYGVECVKRTLRHLRCDTRPFGGLTVIFSGDFRQTLPIVPGGDLNAQAYACFKWSSLWSLLEPFQLTHNLRLLGDHNTQGTVASEFAGWLLRLGGGELQNEDKAIIGIEQVTINFCAGASGVDLVTIDWLYDQLDYKITSQDWNELAKYYAERCLITPLNHTVDEVNQFLNDRAGGEFMISLSFDWREEEEGEPLGEEFFNSFDSPGFSRRRLVLRKGIPMMIIRNLSVAHGLCNGTRVLITGFSPAVLQCLLITGSQSGEEILLPKIKLFHEPDSSMPVRFSRYQFTVVNAFCLTINKSQGQSLDRVAVLLPDGVFAHGQLYVALSRCKSLNNLRVSLPFSAHKAETTSVVLRDVLAR